jgi:hypothetical protein
MSIDPVRASQPGIELQTLEKKAHAAPTSPVVASGKVPKPEIDRAQIAPLQPLIPEHEVQVQLDTPEDGIFIYQVLDKKSGALVLQIPSAEQLRGIHDTQELMQRIAARGKVATSDPASTPVVKGEGNNNGS